MKDPNWRKCIINGDSREIIKRIPDNSIDFILTDPPYNLGQHSTGNIPLPGRSAMNNDVAKWDMVDFNPEEWADEFIRILKPTGNLFIFTSYNQIGRWYNCLDHRFDTTNFMVWHKTNPAPKIFKAGFLNSCELIFTCWNKKHTWNFISQAEMHNFVESPVCMRPERLSDPKHPTQKPISILTKMIEIASNADDIILDPFMGVGSTGVAALQMGRRFIGIELEEDYYTASKQRIEHTLAMSKTLFSEDIASYVNNNTAKEPYTSYLPSDSLDNFFIHKKNVVKGAIKVYDESLAPIIKWPGGKEKELKYILPNLPDFRNYYEPFVGGGSVYMAIKAENYHINDFSEELMDLYQCIYMTDGEFYGYAEEIDKSWERAKSFFLFHGELIDLYLKYRNEQIDEAELKKEVANFCKVNRDAILSISEVLFASVTDVVVSETEKNLFRKMTRMRELETQKAELPEKDLCDNIETAIKSAVYMTYRYLYNDTNIRLHNIPLHCALFFFIRNYAYSGMFRYSKDGDFNVPYGGIAYNSKSLAKKLKFYQSEPVRRHFEHTNLYNLDFEVFLKKTNPGKDDFIFLDPPYDTEFSTYAQNPFTRADQTRLADYMIEHCKAKWMLIIKNTEFIYSLYNRPGIKIRSFEKEYVVSFMNRNDKKTTHLLITNY